MEHNKYNEIVKATRKLKNNISFETLNDFLQKYKIDLDINPSAIPSLINEILIEIKHTDSITLSKLNLMYKKTSQKYWIIRGWDLEYSIRKAKDANQIYSHPSRLEKKGYSHDEIKKIVSDSCKKGHVTLKNRHNYDEIINRRNRGLSKHRYTKIINPLTGVFYTDVESEQKYKEDQRRASISANKNRKPESFNTKIEYYLAQGLSLDDAKAALFDRQIRNGLTYYINQYGLVQGTNKYFSRIEKYGNKIKKLREEFPKKWKTSGKKYSTVSKKFFDSLINETSDLKNLTIFYAENEYFIYDSSNKKIYFYDFYVRELNLIIEYHGVVWHPRKRVQEGWLHPYTKETSEKYYDLDKHKEKLANDKGIDVITIFETDITINKTYIFDELHRRIKSYCNTK